MKGYEITFFTQQDRLHGLKQISEWLLLTARNLGPRGATIVTGSEGCGHNRHILLPAFLSWQTTPRR